MVIRWSASLTCALLRTLACLACAAPLGAESATAAEALHLTWDECWPTGVANRAFDCQSNSGQDVLYCAFSLDQPVSDVIALELVVDVQHSSPTLPSWWRFGQGECRAGALAANGGPPAGTTCVDFWQGEATDGLSYRVTHPRGGANQARIVVTVAVVSELARSLARATLYYGARILVSHERTAGTDSCPGCSEPACLVLNSILVGRVPPAPDVLVELPGPGNGNLATWQGGTGANCAAVPIRARTWGAIKALYR